MPGIEVSAAVLNDGELAHRLQASGIGVTVLSERELNPAQLVGRLRSLMKQWRPDIVHTHRFKENILGSIANRLSRDVPSLRTAHGAPETPRAGLRHLPRRLQHDLDRWCGRHLQQRVVAVTGELAGKLAADYSPESIVTIENGVDIQAIRAEVAAAGFRDEAAEAVHIGIVGRLVPVKRVDLFLEMARNLAADGDRNHWRFHIFGEGPLRDSLARQARDLKIEDITRFHGHRRDIVPCLAALDALVMCSDHEGMPITLLEAMTVETPAAGNPVGGIAELFQGERHGWPAARHDAAGYADAVRAILSDPAERARRVRAALDNVVARYSAERCAGRYLDEYSKLLRRSQDLASR